MRAKRYLPYLVLLAITFLVYALSLDNGFVLYDDDIYVLKNPLLLTPSWSGLAGVFTESYLANYHPLHTLSYLVDRLLFGFDPRGYHCINLLLYASGVLMLYAFLNRAFSDRRLAFLAALIFAVHPVHVESVAWISSRKDVLMLPFLCASAIFHLKHLELNRKISRFYFLGLLFFIGAMLSKQIAITLPILLLAYELLIRRRKWRSAILDKLPYLILGALLAYVAFQAQAGAGAIHPYPGGGLYTTALTMSRVFVRYMGMLAAPMDLSVLYPVAASTSLLEARVWASLALLALLLFGVVWAFRRGQPLPAFTLAWFFIALAPVSNIIPLSRIMADRYLFIPSVGFALFLAWAFLKLRDWSMKLEAPRRAIGRGILHSLAVALLLSYAFLSASRVTVWRDDISLWTDTVSKEPGDAVAWLNLGAALGDQGKMEMAGAAFFKALKLRPRSKKALKNLRQAAFRLDRQGRRLAGKRLLEQADRFLKKQRTP